MLRTTFVLMVLVACHLSLIGRQVWAQVAAGVAGLPSEAQVRTFVKTSDGNWTTTIKTPNGEEREFVYVPPTKVDPRIRVGLSLAEVGQDLRVQYRYSLSNGPAARQELAWLWLETVQPVSVTQVPAGWQEATPQPPGSVALYGPLRGDGPSGVPAGETEFLALEGAILPGVVMVRAMGNTAGAVSVPPGLTERQYEELSMLSKTTTVDVPAIGPAIPAGIGEPELTFDAVLTRIGSHYTEEFEKYEHPYTVEVAQILAVVTREGASLDDPVVREGLVKLRELGARPVDDVWHREMSQALTVCAEALLSGALPLQG